MEYSVKIPSRYEKVGVPGKFSAKELECDTRIVWVDRKLKRGDFVIDKNLSTWKPGEKIPWGEAHSDTD
jgi:hypothetical protein